MEGYLLEVCNLSEDRVIDNIKAVLGSAYFRQFNETGPTTAISSTHLSLKAGAYRDDEYVPSPFDPLADVFNGFIDNIHNNPHLSLEYAIFNLSASRDIKERFGFNDDEIDMELKIKTQAYTDDIFDFVVIHYESMFGSERSKRLWGKDKKGEKATNYAKWIEEVNQELQKILPHTSEQGNLDEYIARQEQERKEELESIETQ